MNILPIDFDLPNDKLSTWHDKWSREKFGEGVLDPGRYYQASKDGLYLYADSVAEDEALNEEKAIRDHVLELLLRIRAINRKLKGVGIKKHLTYQEREELKKSREALYDEFKGLNSRQTTDAQSLNPEPQHGKENAIEQYITGSDKETTMQAIKSLVCGKKGKQAAVIIAVAVSDGYMSKAKFDILKEAFGIDGTKQAFNHAYKLYTETNSTRKGELDAARAALKRAIESAR